MSRPRGGLDADAIREEDIAQSTSNDEKHFGVHQNILQLDRHRSQPQTDLQAQQQQQQTTAPQRSAPRKIVDVAHNAYRRLVFDIILRRTVLPPSKDGRHIPLNLAEDTARPPHLIDERRGNGYVFNAIRTSRYSVLDFIPKQLIFQFTRLGNFYFLCVGIPQTIPGISTTGNYTTILPLLFFVLLTVVKEGYDDYKRHRLDNVENASRVTVLRRDGDNAFFVGLSWSERIRSWLLLLFQLVYGQVARLWNKGRSSRSKERGPEEEEEEEEEGSQGFRWKKAQWRNIHVGDILKLSRDEEVPADLVLLHANGEGDLAYVETMALDGETNLKSRQVPTPLVGQCADIDGLVACNAHFVVEDPNPDLYRFEGRVTVGDETSPLSSAEVIYRGSTLRNTQCAIGLVINTGEECKSRMNANRHPRAKKPALERVSNSIVLVLASYVILLSAGCSIGYKIWHNGTENNSWYLDGADVPAQEIILGFIIQFNNVIPLALYVSLEIVKIGQMLLLNSDVAMYDEKSDTPARCNTNTILEDLGQIGYVFSDKTGTLTENIMKFRKMSVAGTSWLHEADIQKEGGAIASQEAIQEDEPPVSALPTEPQATPNIGRASSVSLPPSLVIPDPSRPSVDSLPVYSRISQTNRRSSSQWRSTGRPDHVQPELTTDDMIEYIRLRPNTPFSRKVVTYILAMALCHTCLPELRDGKVVDFQASSPDELALVRAAEELGFLVVQKSAQSTTLRFTYNDAENLTEEVYEVVDVIEFSSLRKRMSIIVRRPDGRLWLICKGADSVILPRLKMAPLAMKKAQDVRKSADMERELIRKSEQFEPRSSLGGPASVTIRKSFGGPVQKEKGDKPRIFHKSLAGSARFDTTNRSQSLDIQHPIRRSVDALRVRPSPLGRTPSFDAPSRMASLDAVRRSASAARSPKFMSPIPKFQQGSVVPEKFSFLESPSFAAEDEASVFEQCFRHMDDFAAEGLRTLLFADKFIPAKEYQTWKTEFLAASTSLTNRQERVEEVAESIEQNLNLVGATAIEDKLQDGVPDTIDKLRRANIKIWMLTGDKRETAINIAHSARLCRATSDVYILDSTKGDLAGQMLHIAESLGIPETGMAAPSKARRWLRLPFSLPFSLPNFFPPVQRRRNHTVVVIDGHTLGVIEKHKNGSQQSQVRNSKEASEISIFSVDPDLRRLFYSIIPMVDSVICCRASPAQKALLVRSIRTGSGPGKVGKGQNPGLTLAIGDGANDLAMLAEAHVGIGVSGREGLQAARVADYSIAQFRFLSRLLLVHGRWNYMRTAQFILATFWKEMFFYTPAAAYQWFTGYTGTSIYESWSLTVLNTLFTSLCVIVPGIFEQDLSASTLMAVPELYAYGQRGRGLNPPKYVGWMLTAVSEGVIVFFGCWAGYGVFADQHDPGLFPFGDMAFSVCIMWTNWKLLILYTHYKTLPVIIAFSITVSGWWAWNGFLSGIYALSPSPYDIRGGFAHGFGRDLKWWATVAILCAGLMAAEVAFQTVKRNVTIRDIWRRRPDGRRRHPLHFWSWPWLSMWRSFRGLLACTACRSIRKRRNAEAHDADFDEDYDDDIDDADAEMPADKLDLGLWQEMERDPGVRERLRLVNGEDELDEKRKWW